MIRANAHKTWEITKLWSQMNLLQLRFFFRPLFTKQSLVYFSGGVFFFSLTEQNIKQNYDKFYDDFSLKRESSTPIVIYITPITI